MDNLGHDFHIANGESGALRRGLRILHALNESDTHGLKIAEIALATQLPRPTVYRLLEVLVEAQVVRSAADGKRFVSAAVRARPEAKDEWQLLVRKLTPAMRRIAASTGSSVFLVRRVESDALCLHREFGTYPIQVHSIGVGGRQPLGIGAAGLALLSVYSEEEVDRILARSAPRLSKYGGMTLRTMRLLVENSRVRGFAVAANFSVRGVLGVGIAVYDQHNRPLAGMSVGTTIERMSTAQQRKIAALIRSEVKTVRA
jgi:DNA-binding IclR family transcriptional regulator